jgi:hypothetical protein
VSTPPASRWDTDSGTRTSFPARRSITFSCVLPGVAQFRQAGARPRQASNSQASYRRPRPAVRVHRRWPTP